MSVDTKSILLEKIKIIKEELMIQVEKRLEKIHSNTYKDTLAAKFEIDNIDLVSYSSVLSNIYNIYDERFIYDKSKTFFVGYMLFYKFTIIDIRLSDTELNEIVKTDNDFGELSDEIKDSIADDRIEITSIYRDNNIISIEIVIKQIKEKNIIDELEDDIEISSELMDEVIAVYGKIADYANKQSS